MTDRTALPEPVEERARTLSTEVARKLSIYGRVPDAKLSTAANWVVVAQYLRASAAK